MNNKLIINPSAIWDIISYFEYSKQEIKILIIDYLIEISLKSVNNSICFLKKTEWTMPNEQNKNLLE